ncbi:MAG: ABC transporter substrate-binding protein [Acidimicrobiales bacterium]|nr:ABC transporter substrate-binding protein [Acidimicrobiales bacterium]
MRMPERIVCLTEEPTEVLYALGEDKRIVGISQFTVRPEGVRKEKPMVSAFTSARHEKILALDPDLVVGFSDIQADIARDLIKAGIEVWISNHRTVEGILSYVRRLGAMVGAAERADRYADSLARHVESVAERAAGLPTQSHGRSHCGHQSASTRRMTSRGKRLDWALVTPTTSKPARSNICRVPT